MAGQDIFTYNPGNPMEYNIWKLSQEVDSIRTSGGAGGGSSFTKNVSTGLAETEVNGETFAALPTQGDAVKANVIPRIGTLNDLMNLAGNPGELSSATDQTGVVQHNGAQFQARVMMPYYLVDVSTLTNGTIAVPLGVTRIIVGWFAAQTSTESFVTLTAATVEKVGHSWDVLFLPRTANESVYISTPALNLGWYDAGSGLTDYGNHGVIVKTASGWQKASLSDGFKQNPTTGFAETIVDGKKYLALPSDSNGNAKANFSQRTDTLANLLTLAGLPGEISRPTDYQGVVCHTGQVGGAYYIGNDVYKVNVTNNPNLIAEQAISIPRGFRTIVIGGKNEIPHANIVTAGGFAINFQPEEGGSRNDLLDTVPCRLIVLANMTLAPNIQFGATLLDLTTGDNYFEILSNYDFSLNSSSSTTVVNKVVAYG